MVDLCDEVLSPQGRLQDVVQVHWQDLQEAGGAWKRFVLTWHQSPAAYLQWRWYNMCDPRPSRRWSCPQDSGWPTGPAPGAVVQVTDHLVSVEQLETLGLGADLFIGVVLTAQKDKVLESVRQAVVILEGGWV